MVFKPFTHLARQSFTKTLTHGYAQSVVAASQHASSATPLNQISLQPTKFTRTAQLQNAFQNPSSSGAGAKTGHASGATNGDGGLAGYFAAWQLAQQNGDDGDWRQHQFARRIGWKAKDAEDETEASGNFGSRHAEKAAVGADMSARVDEAVAREIQQIQDEHDQAEAQAEARSETASVTESGEAATSTEAVESASEFTAESPAQEISAAEEKSSAPSDRVVQLSHDQKYSDIPAAFQCLLEDGHIPTASAYNALLTAAIKLHSDSTLAVPKALDVYSDMLRRGVTPNEETYTTLIRLLASRSLDAIASKRVLDQQRARFGGMEEPGKFMFQSSEVEHELLTEDHSLSIGTKLFKTAVTRHADISFPLDVYRSLIMACAQGGQVDDMIQIFAHMETQRVVPHATMFPSMIDAFAASGDLKSAVECYNEYKALAIADDSGIFSIVDRKDGEVYAAVVRAYMSCGKEDGGMRFFDKIHSSFDEVTENRASRLEAMEAVIVQDALVQHFLYAGRFTEAVSKAETRLPETVQEEAMAKICIAAADAGNVSVASEAYERLPTDCATMDPAISMLALHVRSGDVRAAEPFWNVIASASQTTPELVQPTAMYSVALIKSGKVEEGLSQARNMFTRIRSAANENSQTREDIDEAIELLGRVLMQTTPVVPSQAAITLLWSMVENGGLLTPVVEHVVASLGPMSISQLSLPDLTLALQVQASMLLNNSALFDAGHSVRLAHMVEIVLSTGMPLDNFTTRIVEQALARIADGRPDLAQRWQSYVQPTMKPTHTPARYSPASEASPVSAPSAEDSFDPYAYATDYRGSAIIAEELENTRGRLDNHLNEALIKFKNMRRVGRHPRYITYAKLITAAAKCGRMNLVHDILGMARHDVPLIPQYSVVKYGWVSILDSMVAACLTLGDRSLAAKYHQELLHMGAAPSANTFGLYITTLKESTKTFDEATEAVKVFHRAAAEGVEPTSFLYNALIGKLGKARRIDDCLLYFAEMRAKAIRPTSVTYGTIVNALCRVSDERFAEEMFDEMESMPNYKPRPAPYNSLIQYFLNTKRDRSKVLAYYERMQSKNIQPTMHTYKLLVDAYASLEPVDMKAAEGVLDSIRASGQQPEAVHYASLIHAKGCVMHDMAGAREVFDSVTSNPRVSLQPCLYQALFEAMVANHKVAETPDLLKNMASRNIQMTPYIANTLIHGWAADGNIDNAKSVYEGIGIHKREPSTYEAMTRAFLASEDRQRANKVVQEMLSRGYPSAVAGKILELVGGGAARAMV